LIGLFWRSPALETDTVLNVVPLETDNSGMGLTGGVVRPAGPVVAAQQRVPVRPTCQSEAPSDLLVSAYSLFYHDPSSCESL
jgi:hypothetical protein